MSRVSELATQTTSMFCKINPAVKTFFVEIYIKINSGWFYVRPYLLSFGRPLKSEQGNVVNQSGIVEIRMYPDVRNCELLEKKSFVTTSPNRKWKQFLHMPGEAAVPQW